MRKRSFILLLAVVVLLTLTACERPVPREDTPEDVDVAPTSEVIIIPTAPPESGEAYPGTDTEQPATETGGETGTDDTAVATTEAPTEATPTPSEQDVVEAGGEVTHVVKAGETLGYIAGLYNVSLEDIVAANDISNVDVLEVGQVLTIKAGAAAEAPADEGTTPTESSGEQTHVVQAGENLFRIGLRYGFTAEELAAYNNIPDISRIDVGQIIKIPPK